MRCWSRDSVAVVAMTALVACGTGAPKANVGAGAPTFPTTFTPAPPLAKPPTGDINKSGFAYMQKLYPKLGVAWTSFLENCRLRLSPASPLNDAKLVAVAEFELTRKGALHAVRLTTSSGNKDFDAAALEVVRDAAPFAEAPAKNVSDDGLIHLSWMFARDVRQAGLANVTLKRVQWPIERALTKFISIGDLHTAASRLELVVDSADISKAAEAARVVKLGKQLSSAIVLAALGHEETNLRRVGVAAAAATKLRDAAPVLRKLARNGADRVVRTGAIGALGQIGDVASVALLTKILDGKISVGGSGLLAAANSLLALGKRQVADAKIAGWLASAKPAERRLALGLLADFSVGQTVPALSKLIRNSSLTRTERVATCRALGNAAATGHRGKAMRALLRGLGAADAGVRAACARGAAKAAGAGVKNRLVYWKVVSLMKDRDNRVRAGATLAAARLEPKHFPKALYLVARERSTLVLTALASGLARVPGKMAFTRLAALSRSKHVDVRRNAARSLLKRSEASARQLVDKLAADKDLQVRLVVFATVTDIAAMGRALDASEPQMRAAALSQLVRLTSRVKQLSSMMHRLTSFKGQLVEQVALVKAWLAH